MRSHIPAHYQHSESAIAKLQLFRPFDGVESAVSKLLSMNWMQPDPKTGVSKELSWPNDFSFRCINRVVVKSTTPRTKGGIIIPDSAKEKPQEGQVVAVGPVAVTKAEN